MLDARTLVERPPHTNRAVVLVSTSQGNYLTMWEIGVEAARPVVGAAVNWRVVACCATTARSLGTAGLDLVEALCALAEAAAAAPKEDRRREA